MFDNTVFKRYDPALPVHLDWTRALPLARSSTRPDRLPLRVLAAGLRLEAIMDAELISTVRLTDGQWLCQVRLTAASGNGHDTMTMHLWVPADAVSKAPHHIMSRRPGPS